MPPEKLRAAVEKLKKDGIDEKVARKVQSFQLFFTPNPVAFGLKHQVHLTQKE